MTYRSVRVDRDGGIRCVREDGVLMFYYWYNCPPDVATSMSKRQRAKLCALSHEHQSIERLNPPVVCAVCREKVYP